MDLHTILAHAVTRYDRQMEKRKNHNPYALGIYLGRVDTIVGYVNNGIDTEAAIRREFNDRLADFVVKFVKEHQKNKSLALMLPQSHDIIGKSKNGR